MSQMPSTPGFHDYRRCVEAGEHQPTSRHSRSECPVEVEHTRPMNEIGPAELDAFMAGLFFIDAAVMGVEPEPTDDPTTETEMVFDCDHCRGVGEVPVGQYDDGQYQTARCPECDGTGEVSY